MPLFQDIHLLFCRTASLFVLTLGFVAMMAGSSALQAQSLAMQDLPGWDRVQRATSAAQSIRVSRPSNLNWTEDALYYTLRDRQDNGANRIQLDLATGEKSAVENEPANQNASRNRSRQRRANVGRARQRLWIQSPDAKWKASYQDLNIVLQQLDDDGNPVGDSLQVTEGGTEKHRFGTACWVYGEELDQQDAMWFSPDSSKLAFYEIDESHMKTYFLTTGNTANYTGLHKEQYPTAGQDNPHVTLHIYDLTSKKTVPVQVDGPKDQYLYGVRFSPDGSELIFHRTNRWQNELDVMAADIETGQSRTIVSETQDTWQKNSPLMRFLADGQRFIWETEKAGWKQYQLRHIDGTEICDLTPAAQYPVHQVVKVDEKNGWFYYSAYSDTNPLNLHLHRSRLDGTDNDRLTSGEFNFSNFQIAADNVHFVATFETVSMPPVTAVWKIEKETTRQIAEIAAMPTKSVEEAGLVPGELFSFLANDGKTRIYGTLYKPSDFDPNKSYPLLIDVYGGPNSVGITNRFRAANPYCEFGFLIAKIGNRGTINRGKAFESATYQNLGIADLDDQADGVRYLAKRSYVDGSRVGIYGHSYGGYMSSLALLRYPDVFHVGVAGAPVTDWRNYDTIYTERYMRTPQENLKGYDGGSCMTHAGELTGKLFILHGLVDDNVHPSNTWQLAKQFHDRGIRFDLMVYPNAAHGFRYNTLRWNYLIQHLAPDESVPTGDSQNHGHSEN